MKYLSNLAGGGAGTIMLLLLFAIDDDPGGGADGASADMVEVRSLEYIFQPCPKIN